MEILENKTIAAEIIGNKTSILDILAINIVDFDFIPLDDFHTSFHMWEDTHKEYMLTDALEIHFVDMVKFRRYAIKILRANLCTGG